MRKALFLLLLCNCHFGFSQQNGAVSFEALGVGGFGSFSYSKEFKRWDKLGLEYRVGLSFTPIDKNNGDGIIIPGLLHATYGNGKHMADFGIGQTLTVTTRLSLFLRMPLSFGYRLQTDGPWFYRIAYTPLISYIYNAQWEHWGGFTVGFNLGKK